MREQRPLRLFPAFSLPVACAALMFASPAAAQCFCLADPVSGKVVHYGCEATPIPNRISEWVSCLTPERKARTTISDSAGFVRIPSGLGGCVPCSPPPPTGGLPDDLRRPLTLASRTFAGPQGYPPSDFAAYGIVIFRSRSTSFDADRHKLICEAYISAIPHFTELEVKREGQMVTVWPVESDKVADRINRLERNKTCELAVRNYGLKTALDATIDAGSAGVQFGDGRGPFLIAWSPANTKGLPDAVVLKADLSHVDSIQQAKSIFEKWVSDIEKNPSLWKNGWSIESVRILIRNWFDEFGQDIVLSINKP